MPRLTITLTDELHRALKEAAAKRRKTIRQLIEESLDANGIRSGKSAAELVALARSRSRLSTAEARDLAVEETAAVRRKPRRR